MRFTDKAAESSLSVPAGLSPALIGKVVTVQVFRKDDGVIKPETLVKFVGVLKTYTLTSKGTHFTLDGSAEKLASDLKDHLEFILYEGS